MSDFVIDFRDNRNTYTPKAIELMRYYDDISIRSYEYNNFTIILSRADDWNVWGPYENTQDNIFIALAGRIALDDAEWQEAKKIQGEGGLACKAIAKMFKTGGISLLEHLNGNFVVIVYDKNINKLHIITDRLGLYPCYYTEHNDRDVVICSHPDILASLSNAAEDWDLPSLAEFLITGTVSFPYSYYKQIQAMDFGCRHTFSINHDKVFHEARHKYFNFQYNIDSKATEWSLAEQLCVAFKRAVEKRTYDLFGQSAVSLSAGLDSRQILCAVNDKNKIWSFCFHDEVNHECKLAGRIADAAGVKFITLERDFDFYADSAEMGVRIAGAMGDFSNNHYLGFRNDFRKMGIDNIISGFYCDLLFKGHLLNKKWNKYLRKDKYSAFEYENYMPLYWFNSSLSKQVEERLYERFPDKIKIDESEMGRLEIERRRLFPLHLEPDNPQALIPQRVMGWYLPIADNDIIDVFLKIPPTYKLNTSMYSKMVELQCGKRISNITNNNTGAKVNASRASLIYHGILRSFHSKIIRRNETLTTRGSWPNYAYLIKKSKKIESLWTRKNGTARDIFKQILGNDPCGGKPQECLATIDEKLFLRLLTLKLWFDQRTDDSAKH